MRTLILALLVFAAFAALPAEAAPCLKLDCLDLPPCVDPRQACTLPDPLECRYYGCRPPDLP